MAGLVPQMLGLGKNHLPTNKRCAICTEQDPRRAIRGLATFRFGPALIVALIGCPPAFSSQHAQASDIGEQVFYAAAQKVGDGSGLSQQTAADFRDMNLWSRVQQAIEQGPVVVCFLEGTYYVSSDKERVMPTLALTGLGHDQHRLIIQGINPNGVIFTRHPDDRMEGQTGPGFLTISQSKNLTVRNLHFTAKHPIGYATHFGSNHDVLIERCSWVDLTGVYYGATGTASSATDHVTFRNCIFKRVGSGGHAHMAYNAYDPKHIRFVDCHFEDCAGDYVRFRDGTDFGVVVGCTFKSTGTYRNTHMPFITVPLFNDDDPALKKKSPNYEYFGTHFLIFNNKFIYDPKEAKGVRAALLFHHSGFDPPGSSYLLTPDQAEILEKGPVTQKRALMLQNFGIRTNSIHFFNNQFDGVLLHAAYRSGAAYGARSKGWSGIIDITDTLNSENVARTIDEALHFFD